MPYVLRGLYARSNVFSKQLSGLTFNGKHSHMHAVMLR